MSQAKSAFEFAKRTLPDLLTKHAGNEGAAFDELAQTYKSERGKEIAEQKAKLETEQKNLTK